MVSSLPGAQEARKRSQLRLDMLTRNVAEPAKGGLERSRFAPSV